MIESFVHLGKLLCGFDRLLKTIRLWLGLCSTVGPIEKRLGPERGGGRCKKGPKECWGGEGGILRRWASGHGTGHGTQQDILGAKMGKNLELELLFVGKKKQFIS